jgi:vanillate O-demethylase ferredoxin subunit
MEIIDTLPDTEADEGNGLLRVAVHSKRLEAANIVSLELRSIEGAPLPPFTAGAHVDVHLPGGIVRQYSLCNDPKERLRYTIAVLRENQSRGGSSLLHDKIQVGDLLHISKPRNNFALLENASSTFLLAGGIGVTPLLAMAERLAALQADFRLHYCGRSPEQMAFRDRLANARFAERVHLHFDNGAESQRMNAEVLFARPVRNAHIYVCGPVGFIDHIVSSARGHGWPDEQIHREYFAAAPGAFGGDSFRVKIASTREILDVPEDRTVVDVLAAAGVHIPVACEQGVCGTCLTGVLAGQIEHHDLYLTEQERVAGQQFLPCCSRGKGLIVLDL